MTVIEQRFMEAVIDYCVRDKKIDWEERKYELAKELYKQIIAGNEQNPCDDDVVTAYDAAEKFIKTYQKLK